MLEIFRATWEIIQASSPWLLFGFFLAGVLNELFSRAMIEKHLKTPGLSATIKAAAFGVPLSLCSCSVIPVAVSLRKSGASKGATASFMVSTPEIGVDSFFLSYGILGPLISITRVISAFFSALLVGVVIDSSEKPAPNPVLPSTVTSPDSLASCCHPLAAGQPGGSPDSQRSKLRSTRLGRMLHYGFIEMVDDLSGVLAFGLVLSGIISFLVPTDLFASLGLSPTSYMFLALFVSLPLYVCATSSTPLGAILLAKGINPGAVLVFLLAGPATNVTTMLAVKKELGTRALVIYLAGIASVALTAGTIIDQIGINNLGLTQAIAPALAQHHEHSWATPVASVLFSALLFFSLLKKGQHWLNRGQAPAL